MTSASESPAAALKRYSAFVEEVLRPQLKQTLLQRDSLAQEVLEYSELRELLHELAQKPQKKSLHTLLDVGERFHVHAKVPSTSLITVDIGLNFHVEMTVSEAQNFVQKHLQHLTQYENLQNSKRNEWQQKAREVSEHVNLVIASIQQLAALQ